MTDRPKDKPEERRRTGPLGEDRTRAETRREPAGDQDATRQIPSRYASGGQGGAEEREPPRRLRRVSQTASQPPSQPPPRNPSEEDRETRAVRNSNVQDTPHDLRESPYPRGYFEAAEEREERLRDMYGGVDWLASFLGFVFAIVIGALFSAVAGLVLIPLGFSVDISGGEFEPAVITGLAVVAVLLFLTYFFGGYVAGRLARFDGGRNGAMTVIWGLILALLLTVIGGVFGDMLPGDLIGQLQDFVQNGAAPAFQGLMSLGLVGLGIAAGVLLIELLGGILGGRVGARYHREIDRTT